MKRYCPDCENLVEVVWHNAHENRIQFVPHDHLWRRAMHANALCTFSGRIVKDRWQPEEEPVDGLRYRCNECGGMQLVRETPTGELRFQFHSAATGDDHTETCDGSSTEVFPKSAVEPPRYHAQEFSYACRYCQRVVQSYVDDPPPSALEAYVRRLEEHTDGHGSPCKGGKTEAVC